MTSANTAIEGSSITVLFDMEQHGLPKAHRDLFINLTPEGVFQHFPRANLAAWKLPETAEVGVLESSSDEESAVPLDDADHDDDVGLGLG